jgi:hypothetical protein
MNHPTHAGAKSRVPSLDKVDIDIIADSNGSGGVCWSHTIKTSGNNDAGKIKLPKGMGSKLKFDLHDNSGLGVRFNASAPFFVREGSAGPCPGTLDSAQCMVDSCDALNLVVIDWNYGNECELHYQLNFVTAANEPIDPYDPVIKNGGGGVKPSL